MKVLLVGGPGDGERVELPELKPEFCYIGCPKASVTGDSQEPSCLNTHKRHYYMPHRFLADGRDLYVYAHESIRTDFNVMAMLVDNYKGKNQ